MNKEQLKRLSQAKESFGDLIKNKTNPFTKSNYADLIALKDVVEPALLEQGFLLLQPLVDGKVVTQIFDLQSENGDLVLFSELALPGSIDPQKEGSAITYYRRYTLQSLFSIAAVDDDGNKAKAKKARKEPAKQMLKKEQYEQLQKPQNFKHIPKYLEQFDMPTEWRANLSALADIID